ncbi:hypothetical protein AHF37_09075 [Paragonimus kellicotti]|nr:hypothetical protein AHF37_09075 [Paragonimus kellicotti]
MVVVSVTDLVVNRRTKSGLVSLQFQARLPQKDFVSEVRAILDVGTFIKEATFLLDLNGTDLDDILNTILDAIFTNSSKSHNLIVSGSNTASPDPNNALEMDRSRGSPLISTAHSAEPQSAIAQVASYT